jgi:hypothetical protein
MTKSHWFREVTLFGFTFFINGGDSPKNIGVRLAGRDNYGCVRAGIVIWHSPGLAIQSDRRGGSRFYTLIPPAIPNVDGV